jgi:hypothetical protein
LQALYRKWLNDIFDVKHPEYYAKHVAYYFIYQRIRYELGSGEFDDHVIKDGREGDPGPNWWRIDDARAEASFDNIVTPDLNKLGLNLMKLLAKVSWIKLLIRLSYLIALIKVRGIINILFKNEIKRVKHSNAEYLI